MGFRLFSLQRLLKYSLNSAVSHPKSFGYFANYSTVDAAQPERTRHKIVNPELKFDEKEENDNNKGKENKKTDKKRRIAVNVVSPSLDEQRRKELQSVVGLHVGPSTIYWAKVQRCGSVLDWNHKVLFPIAEMSRKIQLPKLYEKMYILLEHIPFGDVYVVEGTSQGSPNSLPSSSHATTTLRAQILAMLVALLNTRVESETDDSDSQLDVSEELEYFHKVYFLRPRLMSRLFHLLVGTERVSALVLVDSILDETGNSSLLSISDVVSEAKTCEEAFQEQSQFTSHNSHSPPIYTPVSVPSSIKESYRHLRAVEREGMCQALLIAMTFYDIAVFKDPKVLAQLQI